MGSSPAPTTIKEEKMGKTHEVGGARARKDLIKQIEEAGWRRVKTKSGHLQFVHPILKGRVTVPSKITKNIELSILSQARIRRNIFDEAGK